MNRFIKIVCTKEEAKLIHEQGCLVNEKACNGKYQCYKCRFATVNVVFEEIKKK